MMDSKEEWLWVSALICAGFTSVGLLSVVVILYLIWKEKRGE